MIDHILQQLGKNKAHSEMHSKYNLIAVVLTVNHPAQTLYFPSNLRSINDVCLSLRLEGDETLIELKLEEKKIGKTILQFH